MAKKRIPKARAKRVRRRLHQSNLNRPVKVAGTIDFSNDTTVREIDPNLRGCDKLILQNCVNLQALPKNLKVDLLNIIGCTSLWTLPSGLRAQQIHAGASGLRSIPNGVKVSDALILRGAQFLKRLPTGLTVTELHLSACISLERLPDGLRVSTLDMIGCTAFTTWGEDGEITTPPSANHPRWQRDGRAVILDSCRSLTDLPGWMRALDHLDIRHCTALTHLPETLTYVRDLEVGDSGLTERPAHLNYRDVYWHGVRVNETIAWHPEKLHVDDVWREPNLEVRRVMIDRIGYDRFFAETKAELLDIDEDAGGERKLLRVKLPHGHNRWDRDEPVVCLAVACPSTGRRYMLRVPPHIETCHAGAAWLAGFDDPSLYHPIVET